MSEDVCTLAKVDAGDCNASEYMTFRGWVVDAVYRCDCGATFGYVAKEKPRFCPACGRRCE